MRTTLHVAVVSHHLGLIVTSKTACLGQIVTVTIRPPLKHPGRKIQNLIVWLKLCHKPQHDMGRIVTVSDGVGWSVTVSNWGWRNHQGTKWISVQVKISTVCLKPSHFERHIKISIVKGWLEGTVLRHFSFLFS
jgi:hypothetical protein